MYRSNPSACVGCGDTVSPDEADLSEHGLCCWRCSARGDVMRLHELMRTRVPKWQQLLARGSLSAFCLGSIGFVIALGAMGSPLLALADAALVTTAVFRLLRRDSRAGRALAGVQGVGLALAAAAGGGPVFALAAVGALVGMQVARRAYPLYPGDAPRLLEAEAMPLLLDAPPNR